MPVTLQPTGLKYKNSNNQFQSAVTLKGDDGYSPTIAITDITGGHRITITDASGAHSFDVMDGNVADAPVTDVQVNGTTIVDGEGIANIPIMNTTTPGVVKMTSGRGLEVNTANAIQIVGADIATIKAGTELRKPITPNNAGTATFYGFAKAAGDATQSASSNAIGAYTDSAKSAISQMLNGSVAITGTTPTIDALPGVRYVCGECATLNITTPESGIVDIIFESGSTATALTITPPTGMTMKWANGFDPTTLEANTTYELNIMDGCLGVAGTWS